MTLLKFPKGDMKTVVSITPLKVQADSRTFKQAASVARFGYISIVVEGMESHFDGQELPFQLQTIVKNSVLEKNVQATKSVVDQEAIPGKGSGSARMQGFETSPGSVSESAASPPLPLSLSRKFKFFLRSVFKRLPEPVKSSLRLGVTGLRLLIKTIKMPFWLGRRSLSKTKQLVYLSLYKIRQTYREMMVSEPVQFVKYVWGFFYKYGFLPLRCTPQASLYYLHAFYQFPAIYLLCLRHKAQYIYDAHDFYSQLEDSESQSSFWDKWVVPFELVIETWCMKKAKAVVTVNDGIAQLIQNKFGRQAIVIRNAHDLRLDREPLRCLRQQLNLSADQFLLVSVGHAKPGMAIEEMFEALLTLPENVHLAFLGNEYGPYVQIIQSKGLKPRVHFVPPVKPDEVVPFIRSADGAVILYYSKSADYKYSLPNRFFQSIAAELPLLYPELPEIKRIADHYGVGLPIEPQSPESISASITELMNNPDLTLKLKRNLQLAKQELSWEHEEKVLHDLLLGFLDKS
jgi:glycosyltransferase involved in cell wall biosynthesis